MYYQPTIRIGLDGTVMWRLDGVLHRVDGPAVTYENGTKHWYLNGKSTTGVVQQSPMRTGHKNGGSMVNCTVRMVQRLLMGTVPAGGTSTVRNIGLKNTNTSHR